LQRFDVLSSALNFYRFLLLRDLDDITGVSVSRHLFNCRFASGLHNELDSVAEKLRHPEHNDVDELVLGAADTQIHVVRGVLERICELCAGREQSSCSSKDFERNTILQW
jgi:hypothetical protein